MVFLRKYGTQTTIYFRLFETDGIDLKVDAVHASGDTKIDKDGAGESNTTNGFVDEGQGYSITLTAAEMQAGVIALYIVDQGTKAWLDEVIVIETYGHASALHDFNTDVKGATWDSDTDTLEAIRDLVATRLASTAAVGTHPNVLETVIDGTLISGSVTDLDDNNQTYVIVQETGDDSGGGTDPGEFQIGVTFNSLTQTYDKVHFLGRYVGNAAHIVTLQIKNQTAGTWHDITGTESSSRIQSTAQDQSLEFNILAAYQTSDYFSGSSPNITCYLRLYHKSNAVASHYMYIDMIGLGDMEVIYSAPDNAGITTIQQTVEDSTYGLSALQVLLVALDALIDVYRGTDGKVLVSTDAQDLSGSFDVRVKALTAAAVAAITGAISTGTQQNQLATTGDEQSIMRGDAKTLTLTAGTDWDFTGKKVYFCMKSDVEAGDASAKVNRVASITGTRTAQITLVASETDTVANYTAEWEQRNSDESSPLTVQQFKLHVVWDVRRGT